MNVQKSFVADLAVLLLLALLLTFWGCSGHDTLFTLLDSKDTGVDFNNFIEEDAENNVLEYGYFYNGGGVAAADFNNDGRVDLYFTGNMVANRLYLNQGKMQFRDITDQAGVGLNEGWKTGVSLVDINDDGWMDLYVCRSGAENPALRRNLLYVNDGPTVDSIPTFTEKAAAYGLDDPSYTTQAVFFDYDKDGDTDCFLLNHSVQDYAGFSRLLGSYRRQQNPAYGNKLLRNEDGHFANVTDSSGIVSNVLSFGLGVNVSDFNNDGWSDLYISNDYNENDYLYLNQKNGTFKEVIRQATGHVSLYSMGTDAADLNNDGWSDIVTLDMLPADHERIMLTAGDDNYDKYQELLRAGFHEQTMRNMLQLNNGTNAEGIPVFSEVGQLAGISNTDWSWAALMADFDNDGYKDLFVTNGYARDYTNMEFLKYSTDVQSASRGSGQVPTQMDVIAEMPPIDQPNVVFRNEGNLTFTKKTEAWGFGTKSQSNGAIYADLDNDGDLDIVTNNVNAKAFIYQNNQVATDSTRYLTVQVQAPRYALKAGAKVLLYQSGGTMQMQEYLPVRGFQSAMDGPLHFGMGSRGVDSVRIQWTDGKVQTQRNVSPDKTITLKYNEAQKGANQTSVPAPLFRDVAGIEFTHSGAIRNDFRIQPLLPAMLSHRGPVIAQGIMNGKGVLYIGGDRGQTGHWLDNQGSNPVPAFVQDATFADADAVFFDADGDGDQDLLVGSAGYELNPGDTLLRPRLYVNQKGRWVRGTLPDLRINASCVSVADLDQDGDLDVFIGERVRPGRFPESQGGYLLVNDGKGHFTDKTAQLLPEHATMGMVTKAAFQDLNGDMSPELVSISDWGAIQVWEKDKQGVFRDRSETWGTAPLTGGWSALAASDLDGDGDMDFVVGNRGTNGPWYLTAPQGMNLYADVSSATPPIPIVSLLDQGQEYPYASRDELLGQMPELKKKYPDYRGYAKATLGELLSADRLGAMKKKEIKEYRSGVLENDKGTLRFRPLPVQAQFAPVYAIALVDVNSDGKLDIVMGGNQDKARVRIGKNDANLLQVYLNQGAAGFAYMPQAISGLFIMGDVRSLSVLNKDRELEILIGRVGMPLKTLQIAQKR
jgi:enediyne biosynthesis protein E4